MIVYLDTNVYCRPFDDQSQIRIMEETDSFEDILDKARRGGITLLSSDILIYEVSNILASRKRFEVERYLSLCEKRIEEDDGVKDLAITIRDKCGIKDRDALHLASAIIGKADCFLTCDDDVIKKESTICIEKIGKEYGSRIVISNPKVFCKMEVFNDKD